MNKKILYLFLALLLPGLIFVFLKFFGKNQFDIPIYYTEGVSDVASNCHVTFKGQYQIADSALISLEWKKIITVFIDDTTKDKELSKVRESIGDKFQIIALKNLDQSQLSKWKDCILFMKAPWNVVLMDEQKRIRGYYKTGNLDEMDRLDVELKILLSKY